MANILQIIIEAEDRATKELTKISEAGRKLSNDYKALGITFAALGAAITGAMAAMTVKWANAGDEIYELAQKTGLSTEALSELKYAANLSGSSIGSLETSIRRMQVVISGAKDATSAAAKALRELGLAYEDLAGLSPEQQFERIAQALADIYDPTIKAALAVELFGRSGTDILPMLAEGSAGLEKMRQEARDLGVVFSTKSAKAADALKDSITKLKASMSGATSIIVQKLAPIIKNLADTISSIIKKVKDWTEAHPGLTQAITNVVLGLGIFFTVMGTCLLVIPKLITGIGLLGAAFQGALGPIGWISLAISGLIALGTLLVGNWDKIVGYFSGPAYRATKKLEGAMEDLKESLVPKLEGAIQIIKDDYQSLIDLFQTGEYKNVGFLSDEQIAKIRSVDSALADQLQEYKNLSEAQDTIIAGYDAQERAAREAAIRGRLGEIELALVVPGIKESDKTELKNEQRDLNRELAVITQEDFAASYQSLLDQNAGIIATGLQNQLDTIWTPYLDGIKNGFNDIVTFIETDWVKQMNDAVSAGLITPDIADEAIGNVKKAVEDYLRESAGAKPPVSGRYTPAAPGANTPSWLVEEWLKKLKPLQSGGIVTQPTLAMVGERGAEAIIPLDQLEAGGSGGVTIVNNIGYLLGDEQSLTKFARIIQQKNMENERRTSFPQVNTGYFSGRGGV